MAKWLAVDPGEDTGYSIWDDDELIDAGTAKLWEFGEAVWMAMLTDPVELELMDNHLALSLVGIEGIVCEDFRIYPWEAKKGTLNWDQVRTARLIGALTLIAKMCGLWWKLQGAKIKERAMAAGAEHFFLSPRHENRHANDSIMHAIYHRATLKGVAPVEETEPSDALET
jgi:hypothetical protein